MILILNVCKEKLHYYEFVKPVEDILRNLKIDFFVKNYLEVDKDILRKCDKVIICGTSLRDNCFLENLDSFNWIKTFDKPLLGICAGMQIIGLIFNGKLKQKSEVGFYFENFKKEFLGLNNKKEVYHLHNNWIEFSSEFEEFCDSKINQAVKHKHKDFFGVLFHPEVRQKDLIKNFCLL